MNKRFLVVLVMVCLFGLSTNKVLASGFNLKSIGSVNTSGRQISHWWYSSSNPTFVGEAPSGSTVIINVDGSETSVTADGSNNWSYSTGSLSNGDHSVSISNNGSTISFTLTAGAENVNWDTVNADAGTTTLPTVGIVIPTMIFSGTGAGLVILAKRILKK